MASAWGDSWGSAWGDSWGTISATVAPVVGTAIENTTATEVKSQYLICDRTGFRRTVREGLVQDGHYKSVMTRPKSRDPYHPQESIGSRSDAQRGPQNPEGDDVFISTAISADDL